MTTPPPGTSGIPQYDATMFQGDSIEMIVTWTEEDGVTPVNLTGKVLRMAVDENGTRVLLLERGVVNPLGEFLASNSTGVMTITVSGAATASWDNPISYAIVADPGTVNAAVLVTGDYFMQKAVSAA